MPRAHRAGRDLAFLPGTVDERNLVETLSCDTSYLNPLGYILRCVRIVIVGLDTGQHSVADSEVVLQ
eukprot:5580894-Prorocentrum_lima.AAC.1